MSSTDFFDDDLVGRKQSATMGTVASGSDSIAASVPGRDDVSANPVSDLNLTRMAKHREEVNNQVADAMKEMEQLRRRQEDLEREKQSLEDMARKQTEYERGKQELADSLTQSAALLEKQELQAARLTELYAITRQRFKDMLQRLQSIDDTTWPEDAIRDELNKALVLIDDARKEYHRALAKIEGSGGAGDLPPEVIQSVTSERILGQPAASTGFGHWFKIGLAATLPLIIAILILFMGIVLKSNR